VTGYLQFWMTSPELHARLLAVMPAILWSADATTFRFTYVSGGAESILGYPVERWTDDPDFWISHLHPDDNHIPALCHAETVAGRDHDLVYRMFAALPDPENPWTPAISVMQGLHAALELYFQDGVDAAVRRHVRLGRAV
jgi:PAS domain-containing protein